MQKLKIEDPQRFQFASTVIKDSKTGITSNRRLLVVRGGHFYYYSNAPKQFDGNPRSLQYLHELPKSSIDLVNIKKIKPFEINSSTFEIIFDERHLMEREDIRKTMVQNVKFVPKNKKDEIIWRFTCQTQLIKQKWVTYLSQLRQYFLKEQETIQNFFLDLQKKQKAQNEVSNPRNSKIPWRESTVQRKQYSAFDVKSMADLSGRDIDNSFDEFPITKQISRISSSFTEKAHLNNFQTYPETMHKNELGPSKQNFMKKKHSVQPLSSSEF